jgi:adenosylhomocysteine nucleosidase
MILLFYAFGMELRPFRRRLDERRRLNLDGLKGFRSRFGKLELAAVATGIGPQRAAEAAHRAFKAVGNPELVIIAGVAGALSPGLAIGDVVVADRLVTADSEDGLAHHVIEIDRERVEELSTILIEAGMAISTGAIFTSPRVLASGADKRAAREASGAIAVDMESAAIGLEAAKFGFPIVCLRSVMDAADEDLVAAGFTGADGQVNALKTVRTLASTPATILRLPRMMYNLSLASRALADALETVLGSAS